MPRADYGTITTDEKELAGRTVTELSTNRKSQVVVCLPQTETGRTGRTGRSWPWEFCHLG